MLTEGVGRKTLETDTSVYRGPGTKRISGWPRVALVLGHGIDLTERMFRVLLLLKFMRTSFTDFGLEGSRFWTPKSTVGTKTNPSKRL